MPPKTKQERLAKTMKDTKFNVNNQLKSTLNSFQTLKKRKRLALSQTLLRKEELVSRGEQLKKVKLLHYRMQIPSLRQFNNVKSLFLFIHLANPKKETKTLHIIRNTLQQQLIEQGSVEFDSEEQLSLEDLQNLYVDQVAENVQKKEREEMKKMSEIIWNQRNKYKQENFVTPEHLQSIPNAGKERISVLLGQNIKNQIEEKKRELAFIQKKRYLSKRTKQMVKVLPQFMISFNDSRRTKWDVIIIITTIYNCFYIPFEIAFQPSVNFVIEVLNSTIDLLFYIDILLNFRTTFMTEEGEELLDKKQIAKRYILNGTFFVDVLSILPLNAIIPGDFKYLDIIGMLKLVRISRIGKLISRLDLSEEIKTVITTAKLLQIIRVCQLFFLLIFYFHVCACIWFFEARIYEIWIPAIEFGTLQTDVFIADLEKQYFTCMHYAVLQLTGNEMGARTNFENFITALYILCGALISANIFGEMTVLVEILNKKSSQFQEQIDSANTAMKNIGLPRHLSKEIRDYLIYTLSTQDQQQELDQFLSLISPSLKLKVSWQIFEGIIKTNLVFKSIKQDYELSSKNDYLQNGEGTDLVTLVVRKLEIQLNGPEDIIIKQGDETHDIFFIAKGDNFVSVQDSLNTEVENFKKLIPGDHFGEISLIYGCPRTATVMSGNYCTYAKLTQENYKVLLSEIPEAEEAFIKYTYTYSDKHKKWLLKTLQQLPFFHDIEEWTLHRIIHSFKRRVLDKGSVIYKPEDEVTTLRIVQDGVIDIFTYFDNKEFIIEKLMRGSLLNHRSFFLEESSAVFAKAAKTSIVLEISLQDLEKFQQDSPIFEKRLLSFETKILNTGKPFPVDYLLQVPKRNIIDPNFTTPDRMKRMVIFKLAVMRRIQELRIQKSKPKLSDLLKELKKGGPSQRMEVRRKILALYEFDNNDQGNHHDNLHGQIEMDKEDLKETNQTYLNMKMKIKKIMKELGLQEKILESMDQKIIKHKRVMK